MGFSFSILIDLFFRRNFWEIKNQPCCQDHIIGISSTFFLLKKENITKTPHLPTHSIHFLSYTFSKGNP